jgi:hypothetical protein
VPVLLIVRTSDGRTRYMNATEAIRSAQRANPGKPIRQIVFIGEDFSKNRWRNERNRPDFQVGLSFRQRFQGSRAAPAR